jgi:hypothetical protein
VSTTTISPETTKTVASNPSDSGIGGVGSAFGGGGPYIVPCKINGVCESFENHEQCPSDCPTTTTTVKTTTTASVQPYFCGNGTCDAGEDFTNCPQDCVIVTPQNQTGNGPWGWLTGGFVNAGELLWWIILLELIIAALLWIVKTNSKKEQVQAKTP